MQKSPNKHVLNFGEKLWSQIFSNAPWSWWVQPKWVLPRRRRKVKEKVRCGISTKCRRRPCMAFSWEEDKLKYKMPNAVTTKKMFSQHFGHQEWAKDM